jgi:hypothetical protein
MTEDGRRTAATLYILYTSLVLPLAAETGDGSIRAPAGTSEIVLATSARMAGAIDSLTWGGMQFIDAADHGRELQSACSFDLARPGPFWAECYNPTEAGSRHDGAGATSTSRLLEYAAQGAELRTRTQMAFWLNPGERSEGRPALNTNALSGHVLGKRVRIGCEGLPQVLDYRVEFGVPAGERHTLAQFEALTGYMPEEFGRFWSFDPATGELKPLSDGPGEIDRPVILATEDGTHAMGIFAHPVAGAAGPRYGRWRFVGPRVTKWNCVFRVRDPAGVAPGSHRFQMFVPVGSLEDVRAALRQLAAAQP